MLVPRAPQLLPGVRNSLGARPRRLAHHLFAPPRSGLLTRNSRLVTRVSYRSLPGVGCSFLVHLTSKSPPAPGTRNALPAQAGCVRHSTTHTGHTNKPSPVAHMAHHVPPGCRVHKSLRTSLPADLHHRCAREHTYTTSLTDCHHFMYHIAFKFQHKWKTNFATMWSSTKVQSEACRVLTRRSPH